MLRLAGKLGSQLGYRQWKRTGVSLLTLLFSTLGIPHVFALQSPLYAII